MRTLKSLKLLSVLFAALVSLDASGQKAAVKTNLLYDIAAYTANLGVEIGLAPRWTLDVSANYNGWTLSDNRRWKHWVVQPEARYWLCDRFAGHFFGLHAHGGQFNIGGLKNGISFLGSDFSKLENRRYQGWLAGAASPTDTRGFWASTGISKPRSAWDTSTPASTPIPAPIAAAR